MLICSRMTSIRCNLYHRLKPRFFICMLEAQFERELNRSRTSLLIERASGTETLIQHFGRLSKQCIRYKGIDISKIWMIDHIEGLCSKLQLQRIADRELALY